MDDLAAGFTAGQDPLRIFAIDGVHCAMLICSDMQSEAVAAEVAASDAQVILHSLTSNEDFGGIHYLGREFNSWDVFANRAGPEGGWTFPGFAQIIDPAGNLRAYTRDETQSSFVTFDMGVFEPAQG